MMHPFTQSGKLLSVLLIACLICYGFNYHITKTLLHVTAVIALITWVRLAVHGFKPTTRHEISLKLSDPRVIMSLLLCTSILIVLITSSASDNSQSLRFRSDFSIPAFCFALILPLAILDKSLLRLLNWAIPIAIVTMAAPGIIDFYSQHKATYRTSGNLSMQIIYATNLCVLAASATILMLNTAPKRNPVLFSLLTLSLILGGWAILLSGSRGPILALVISTIIVMTLFGIKKLGSLKGLFILILAFIVLGAGVTQTNTYERFERGVKYVQSGTKDSSIGLRLEMWKGATDMISTHPLSGGGVGNHIRFFKEKLAEDPEYVLPRVAKFPHLHNDWLNIMAWIGIPLGVLFLSFIYYPFFWAMRHRITLPAKVILVASFVYFLNGLTNCPSTRATSLTLMLLVICLFMVAARTQDPVSEAKTL